MTTIYSTSHPAVADGRERARYIADGLISNRAPCFTHLQGVPLTADQLDRRGFTDAANAKRHYDAAWTEWAWTRHGRMPVR